MPQSSSQLRPRQAASRVDPLGRCAGTTKRPGNAIRQLLRSAPNARFAAARKNSAMRAMPSLQTRRARRHQHGAYSSLRLSFLTLN
eukprot:CAMPEP_0185829356 /NCGR_PEP_ID=MMETSP1353-20130828/205_1 /TAXON_ID=1077150 /ORGANISM="Erythrolobus australicus, Strain CCMP3124" /LENGTH=85 /DNA_ID=CAMNT_0028527139 /DNA_START=680 /DNA_END=934 /DNA_ORIENTATION=-